MNIDSERDSPTEREKFDELLAKVGAFAQSRLSVG